MRRILLSLMLICVAVYASADILNAEGTEYKYSLWLGGHYDTYDNYGKKVGEYRHLYDNVYPEARFKMWAIGDDFYLNFDGHFYDNKNISGYFQGKLSNRLKAKVDYRLFRRQLQTDLLDVMNAREELENGNPGGKMVTHEDLDPGFDFNYDRHQIESEVEFLINEEHDVKFKAAHRFWADNGNEQRISSTHCFSCHLTSKAVEVDRKLNQFNIGLEGHPGPVGLSYNFIYSKFQSDAPIPSIFYDPAKHPVNGGSAEEFSSRVIYENEETIFGVYPETEKFGNRVRFFADIGRHRLTGSGFYYQAKNVNIPDPDSILGGTTDLKTTTVGGTVNFLALINPRAQLVAKTAISRTDADDIFIDMPNWREDRAGGGQDFDFTRYSSLDRLEGKGSLELTYRLNPKITLAALGGFEYTRRDDFPQMDAEYATKKYIGQAKLNYRKGLSYNARFKYRLEMTEDPFQSFRGLFEEEGRTTIVTLPGSPQPYYFQREDLKYQEVTTLPTMSHQIEFANNVKLNSNASWNNNIKFKFEKNDDLDSLEVENTFFEPATGITYMPDPRWVLSAGGAYQYFKSKGPVTVAMFDG